MRQASELFEVVEEGIVEGETPTIDSTTQR